MKMKNQLLLSLAVFICILIGCKSSTNNEEEQFLFEPLETRPMNLNLKNSDAFVKDVVDVKLSCSKPPTIQEVRTGEMKYTDNFYSLRQAYKLGIPIVSADYSSNSKIYVRDYSRYLPCTSDDGKTIIKYGHVIRAVIEIEDLDASAGTDLASIAASGTIGKKRQSFYLYKNGIDNPEIDEIISTVSGKVFDVENYSLYQTVMTKMIALLKKPETKWSVNQIGIIQQVTDDLFLEEAPIVAYAISKIQKGKNCEEIKASFNANKTAIEIVERTFSAMDINCDASSPSDEAKLKAKKLLQGIKVK